MTQNNKNASSRENINLAKISIPRKEKWILRERLFEKLNSACEQKAVWVAAPGGSGKTVLLTTYIKEKKIPCTWYKVDEGDRDIASFFYYMGLAGKKAAPRRKKDLPILTPEYLAGLQVFARNFFREIFSRVKSPGIIVFDNYQNIPDESPLHDVLNWAIEECPKEMTLIILSRNKPPSQLARLRLHNEMACLDEDDIRLSREETSEVAHLHKNKNLTVAQLDKLYDQTQGWIAGLVLLLNQSDAEQSIPHTIKSALQPEIFDYFANQTLNHMSEEEQKFLLKTALLPQMTIAMAENLSNNPHTSKILKKLVHNHYFTYCHRGSTTHYEYHPLFRQFLLAKSQKQFSPNQLPAIQNHAANLLLQNNQIAAAVALLIDSNNWPQLIELIIKQAQTMLDQGRNLTLQSWIEKIPGDIFASSPWLQYWLGASQLSINPPLALQNFEQAYQQFYSSNDSTGLYLSWSGISDAYQFSWNGYTDLDLWIKELDSLQSTHIDFPSRDIEVMVTARMLCNLMYRQPDHPDAKQWDKHLWDLLQTNNSPTNCIMMAIYMQPYCMWIGDYNRVALLTQMFSSIADNPELPPFVRITWLLVESYYKCMIGETKQSIATALKGLHLAEQSGMYWRNSLLLAQKAGAELSEGLTDEAFKTLATMQSLIQPGQLLETAYYHQLSAWASYLRNEHSQASQQMEEALALSEKAGTPYPIALHKVGLAQMLFSQEKSDEGFRHLLESRNIAKSMNSLIIIYMCDMAEAHELLRQNKLTQAIDILTKALKVGRENNYLNFFYWHPKNLSKLCITAIINNIEVTFVKELITQRKLIPEHLPTHTDDWPWQVKLHTLNRFGIIKNDKPLRPSSKVQQFLKALIALGGRDVHEETLANALWPDAEGDAAHQNFATTLHRARKLLGNDVIQLRQNQLSLNPRLCWLDIWTLKRTLSEIEKAIINNKEALPKLTEQAIKLYQGPFLGADENESWMLSAREQLSNRFLRILCKVADTFCQTNECTQALSCYQKGLEIDDLAENLYQGLIHCHSCAGNKAEGLAVYQRCRERLKTSFGIEPSSETERLHLELKNI